MSSPSTTGSRETKADPEDIIEFNRPHLTGAELSYIESARTNFQLAGDGPFTSRCHAWLEKTTACTRALLTHSCTAALEMAAMLADLSPGDEVIMPSYTFVSTANAFVLRGGVPVFVDIREDTLNLDETRIEAAITSRTRAIVPVHYAGVACEMQTIMDIARRHELLVIEDAAQAIMASYDGRALGSIGDLGTYSFHETKNVMSGEGGALLINTPRYCQAAEIMRQKGTDRARFMRGEVDAYTWRSMGSSFLPGEMVAAFLYAQIEHASSITSARLQCWERYHSLLEDAEDQGLLRRPVVPAKSRHNAHMYYILVGEGVDRARLLERLRELGIVCLFHYVPLHDSPAGRRYGRWHGDLTTTDNCARRVVRLPLWVGMTEAHQTRVVEAVVSTLRGG